MGDSNQKSEVSVADLKRELAKSIQKQIDRFSKTLENLRAREMNKSENCPICGNEDKPGACTCVLAKNSRFEVSELAKGVLRSARAILGDAKYKEIYPDVDLNGPQWTGPGAPEEEGEFHTPAHSFQIIGNCGGCGGPVTDNDLQPAQNSGFCDDCFLSGHPIEAAVGDVVNKAEPKSKDDQQQKGRNTIERAFHNRQNIPDYWAKRRERDDAEANALKEKWKAAGHNVTVKAELCKCGKMCKAGAGCMVKAEGHDDYKPTCPKCKTDDKVKFQGKDFVCSCGHNFNQKKSEDFIDLKAEGKRPTSTDDAASGGPRLKNKGAVTPEPVKATKPVKGNVDEGSGGKITKGKGFKKGEVPTAKPPTAAPTTAKPPTSQSNPGKTKAATPKLAAPATASSMLSVRGYRKAYEIVPESGKDKNDITMDKALGEPETRGGRVKTPKAPTPGAAPAAPAQALKPPKNPALDKLKTMARSESASFPVFAKNEHLLGICPLCSKEEHLGNCG